MSTFYVLFLVLFPLLGAFVTYIFGIRKPKSREIIAISITSIEFVVMIIALFTYKQMDNSVVFDKVLGGLSFKLDGFRVLYSLISIFMWLKTNIYIGVYLVHYFLIFQHN